MRAAFLIGRILFGGFFIYSGINHLINGQAMSGYAASKGVPMATVAVFLTGLLLLIGGVSIVLGYLPKLGIAALVVFLLPVTLMMHAFWAVDDPQQRMAEMGNFTKNLALLGGALALSAVREPWPLSVAERSGVGASTRRRVPAP